MTSIDPHIFRAYDIRGRADEQLTEDACRQIGQAFGSVLRERYNIEQPKVAVGRDARTHSIRLENALVEGLMAAGCHCLLIGDTPSPVNYFTICDRSLDGGVQVTASHNPAHDNGLKLQLRDAEAFAGDDLQDLRERIERGDVLQGRGIEETIDGLDPYLDHLEGLFAGAGQGLRVVVDGGNGIAGPVYCAGLRRVGCEVIELYTEPDGTFPNHPADPSKHDTLKELQALVKKKQANLGFGYDGDGDRVGLVDADGKIRTADEILLLLARDHLTRHPGAPVVFTVSNSGALQTEIEAWGGKPIMTKVGHSFVEHAMLDEDALLGGEQSGHFFCGEDYYPFDDALAASLRLLRIVSESGQSLAELCAGFPAVFQTPEMRPHCPDNKKADVIKRVIKHFQKDYEVNTLDGARIDFGDGAWAGVRMSNTSPCLSICIEARSQKKLKEVQKIVFDHLKEYPEVSQT